MGWCLECHRNPAEHVRDPALVTQLDWTFTTPKGENESDRAYEARFREEKQAYHQFWLDFNRIQPSEDCSTCHR